MTVERKPHPTLTDFRPRRQGKITKNVLTSTSFVI